MKGLEDLKKLSIDLNNQNLIDETFEFNTKNDLSIYTSLDYKKLLILPQNELPSEDYTKVDFYSWTNDVIRLDISYINTFDKIYNYYLNNNDNPNLNTFIKEKIDSFINELINKGYTDIICSLIYNPSNYNNLLKDNINYIYPIFSISISYNDCKLLVSYFNNGISVILSYELINNQLINDIKLSLKHTFINDV